MKLEDLENMIEELKADGTIGIGSEVYIDVKSVESCQDFGRLSEAYADNIAEDGGDLVLVIR